MADERKKIVVLGGGVGAMTAAFHLTNPPDWQEKYDVTVYQLGWRLGGKGASGRGEYGRIEEHGLHMWYGFYENAFQMIQAVYRENGRKRGQPLSRWEEAFKPRSAEGFVPAMRAALRDYMSFVGADTLEWSPNTERVKRLLGTMRPDR